MLRSMFRVAPRRTVAQTRSMATLPTPSPTVYPYNSKAIIIPAPSEPPTPGLLKGKGLMAHLRETLLPSDRTLRLLQTLFAHRSPSRLLPGAIVHLSLKRAPFTFSGVVIDIRRRGVETSFVLRNVVQRTGVEMRFFIASDNITDIRISRRADGKDGRRERRAKLYYLRDDPVKMNAISSGAKRAAERVVATK